MLLYYIFIFLSSCFLIVIFGKWVIEALIRISRFLGWKEFVVAFFSISLGAVIPEFFIGLSSALRKSPELSFGNIVGQNIILFTLAPALCVLILKNLEIESRTVRTGSTFAVLAVILPFLLILDHQLSRIDGAVLILCFLLYIVWFFLKKERFTKTYEDEDGKYLFKRFSNFFRDIVIIFGGLILVVFFAQGIIVSAQFFSQTLKISLPLIGILIVGLGTALPETFLSINLASKSQFPLLKNLSRYQGSQWMILGGLMGAVAVSSTLVLGIVVLIHPIEVVDFSLFAIARIFLIISALFFLFFVRTHKKITTKEALFLLGIYITFLLFEIFTK